MGRSLQLMKRLAVHSCHLNGRGCYHYYQDLALVLLHETTKGLVVLLTRRAKEIVILSRFVLVTRHWDEASVPSEEQSLVKGHDRVFGMEVSHPGEFLRHHL